MLENISKVMNNGNKKKMIVLITGFVVLALVLCIGALCWSVQHNARVKEARKACEVQVAQVTKANKSWNKLIKNSLLVSFAKEDSENGKLLNKLMKLRIPETVVCNANSPEALGAQNAQAVAAAQWYSDNAQRIRSITSIMIDKAAGDESTQEDKKKEEESQKQLQKLTDPVIRKAPRVNRRPRLNIPNIPPDPVETAKRKAQEEAIKEAEKKEAEKKKEEELRKQIEKELREQLKKEQEEKKAAEKKAEEDRKKKEEEEKKKQTTPPTPTPPAPGSGGSTGGTQNPPVTPGDSTGGNVTTPPPATTGGTNAN
ncbi:hypothetical protein [Gardnerella pickettii]|uniref:hypothetical protein n=1 Tax=Gardnerella pickettii TaxID=2914924 RepID=UPI00026344F1|nr:hypothetical protein [Gardnerella pickettii]EIK84891.1 hypothetical protein CGSMWGv00703C2mash_04021 [Gardnerella pickettii 00703C2mash]